MVRNENITFLVNIEKIPLLAEHPVQSLGRLYTADLSDKHTVATVTSQLVDSLTKINQNYPPGKLVLPAHPPPIDDVAVKAE